jgi:Zn-finger nucleic acid-binding protein
MLEGIICPNCGANIIEANLREKLACPHCKKDLKDRSYLDFLEYLMTNGIVENLDFFDAAVYSEDIERFDQEDEDDVDITEHEKRKDTFNLYENEMVKQQEEEELDYKDFEGLDEDWEDFNST